jgi:hypothetical protein
MDGYINAVHNYVNACIHMHTNERRGFFIAYGMRVADPTSSTEPILSKVSPEAACASKHAVRTAACLLWGGKHPRAPTDRT